MRARSAEDILELDAELDKDMRSLKPLLEENSQAALRIAAGAKGSLDYAALGYTIHNIYCLMENYFLRIAKTFENNIEGESWHRDLVRRMTLDIEGLRPAFLDDTTALAIDELRSFRHVFRNAYQGGLKGAKVAELQQTLPETLEAFAQRHEIFIKKLRAMAGT